MSSYQRNMFNIRLFPPGKLAILCSALYAGGCLSLLLPRAAHGVIYGLSPKGMGFYIIANLGDIAFNNIWFYITD